MQPILTFIKSDENNTVDELNFSYKPEEKIKFWSVLKQQTLFIDKVMKFAKENDLNVVLGYGGAFDNTKIRKVTIQKVKRLNDRYEISFCTVFDFDRHYPDKYTNTNPVELLFNKFLDEYSKSLLERKNEDERG